MGQILSSVWKLFIVHGGPVRYLRTHADLLSSYGKAWERGDIQAIMDHFADDFWYSDAISQQGIRTKDALKKHLLEVFERFPRQTWTVNAMLFPHYTLGKFAIYYEFKLEGKEPNFSGSGMERIEFRGDRLIEDRIHLQFRELDSRTPLGFRI